MAAGGPSRPTHSRPAPWIIAGRIKGRFTASEKPVPDDFEQTFVAIGRLACEEHYRVGKHMITRWLDRAGMWRLIELRRAHVRRRKREEARVGGKQAAEVERLEVDTLAALGLPDPLIVAEAADYLRRPIGGGWFVSRRDDGDWTIGISRKSAAQLLAMAVRHGFDVECGRGGAG